MNDRFPRANKYHPEWLRASATGGANVLWLAEWLSEAVNLRPGMRVLDLGCGRAMSSIFLHREFGVQVGATDLWFSATENLQRICEAGVGDGVFPIHSDAQALPYAEDFFDAIVSLDSLPYYGTGDLYLNYLARFAKPGGTIAMAGAGFTQGIDQVPEALRKWWEPNMHSLHSAAWWRAHWERSGIVDIELADSMLDGWKHWLEWQRFVAPHNLQGEHLTYIRCVARRRADAILDRIITSIPAQYTPLPLLRS